MLSLQKLSLGRALEPIFYDAINETFLSLTRLDQKKYIIQSKLGITKRTDQIFIDETNEKTKKQFFAKSLYFLKNDTELLLSLLTEMIPSNGFSDFLRNLEANKDEYKLLATFEKRIKIDTYRVPAQVKGIQSTHSVREIHRGHVLLVSLSCNMLHSSLDGVYAKRLMINIMNSIKKPPQGSF
jgi:hypothetical protein